MREQSALIRQWILLTPLGARHDWLAVHSRLSTTLEFRNWILGFGADARILNVLALFDTPSIKQCVFGTDSLREMRGASANLDRSNRVQTKQVLTRGLPQRAAVKQVYANGASAQFAVDNADAHSVRTACADVMSYSQNVVRLFVPLGIG